LNAKADIDLDLDGKGVDVDDCRRFQSRIASEIKQLDHFRGSETMVGCNVSQMLLSVPILIGLWLAITSWC